MGLRAGLDRCGKSIPTGIRSPDRPARRQSLYRLRYPAHGILVLYIYIYIPYIYIYINRIFRQITRALSIQKRSKFVKNEHVRYTLERYER